MGVWRSGCRCMGRPSGVESLGSPWGNTDGAALQKRAFMIQTLRIEHTVLNVEKFLVFYVGESPVTEVGCIRRGRRDLLGRGDYRKRLRGVGGLLERERETRVKVVGT